MNTFAIQQLRQKLAADKPIYGLWITLESPSITEMAVALGLDWIVIDAEHGHLDWGDIVHHLRAAVRSHTVTLVRLTELNVGLIKRALDIGADGVLLPWIETADQLRHAVSFAKFPPQGVRGIGAERATMWGQCFAEHVAVANENVLVIPLMETVTAGKNIRALLEVPGVDLFFFGPADYSATAGYAGQWEGPGVAEQLLAIKDQVRAAQAAGGIGRLHPLPRSPARPRLRVGQRPLLLRPDARDIFLTECRVTAATCQEARLPDHSWEI